MQRSRTILIVGAGLEQQLAIQEAKSLGLRVVACDGDPAAPGLRDADVAASLDIRDAEAVLRLATAEHVEGVFSHAVDLPTVVARVASGLRLPGLRPDVALRASDKEQRLMALRAAGVPCASFSSAQSVDDLRQAAAEIGYPVVVKPVDSSGARGITLVRQPRHLAAAYNAAMQYSHDGRAVVEELMYGPQVSTESVVYAGQIYTFAFADRNYERTDLLPHFIEDGINFPSALPANEQRAVLDVAERAIRALGIDFGPAKGDIIIDRGEAKVIEMAPRTSGGWFGAGSIRFATGVNALRPLVQMMMGDSPDLDELHPTRCLGCAQRYVMARRAGTVTSISGVEEASLMPGVEMSVMFLPKIGSSVRPPTNHAERFGQIICTAPQRAEAIRLCEAAVARIRISVDE